jgi:hypothetical protein
MNENDDVSALSRGPSLPYRTGTLLVGTRYHRPSRVPSRRPVSLVSSRKLRTRYRYVHYCTNYEYPRGMLYRYIVSIHHVGKRVLVWPPAVNIQIENLVIQVVGINQGISRLSHQSGSHQPSLASSTCENLARAACHVLFFRGKIEEFSMKENESI